MEGGLWGENNKWGKENETKRFISNCSMRGGLITYLLDDFLFIFVTKD